MGGARHLGEAVLQLGDRRPRTLALFGELGAEHVGAPRPVALALLGPGGARLGDLGPLTLVAQLLLDALDRRSALAVGLLPRSGDLGLGALARRGDVGLGDAARDGHLLFE